MTLEQAGGGRTRTSVLAERALLSLSTICTLAIAAWVWWYSGYGIDFTDEGYYLVWISHPYNYPVSATQFGFIYHPLYELLGGNIAALRHCNALITFGLSWLLVNLFLKTVFGHHALERIPRLIISAAIATASFASLVFAGLWLPTPSYNSLAFQAMLVAASGLLLADTQGTYKSIVGWLMIGAGGWLAFMAKPTTAAALGLLISCCLWFGGKLRIRLLVVSVVTAACLMTLSALAIDGSVSAFVERLRAGVEIAGVLGTGSHFSHLLRIDGFRLGRNGENLLLVGIVSSFVVAYLTQVRAKSMAYLGALLSMALALVCVSIIFGLGCKPSRVGQFQSILLSSVFFATVLLGFSINRFKGGGQVSRFLWVLGVTLLVFPHAYAFGTSNNYWIISANAGLFWILAGFVFLVPASSNPKFSALLMSLGVSVQLLAVVLVQNGIDAPYRQQQPLHENDFAIDVGKPGATLILSKSFGQYLRNADNLAKQAGFTPGTPMIDLSGQSPGVLYALGASNIGLPWLLGGYPGSNAFAVSMLRTVSCQELSAAWLLAEPEGPLKISPDILRSFGANLVTDFQVVGEFKTAEGAGGYKEARAQQLLKPIRSDEVAIAACVALRASKQ